MMWMAFIRPVENIYDWWFAGLGKLPHQVSFAFESWTWTSRHSGVHMFLCLGMVGSQEAVNFGVALFLPLPPKKKGKKKKSRIPV